MSQGWEGQRWDKVSWHIPAEEMSLDRVLSATGCTQVHDGEVKDAILHEDRFIGFLSYLIPMNKILTPLAYVGNRTAKIVHTPQPSTLCYPQLQGRSQGGLGVCVSMALTAIIMSFVHPWFHHHYLITELRNCSIKKGWLEFEGRGEGVHIISCLHFQGSTWGLLQWKRIEMEDTHRRVCNNQHLYKYWLAWAHNLPLRLIENSLPPL